MTQKAKELHEKKGTLRPLQKFPCRRVNMRKLPKLYDKAGKKIEAAIIMERAGRRLAAAKAYREAGEYKRASVLSRKKAW